MGRVSGLAMGGIGSDPCVNLSYFYIAILSYYLVMPSNVSEPSSLKSKLKTSGV